MSVRVVYVQRSRRGGSLTGVRLAGRSGEDIWTLPDRPSEETPADDVALAAAWLKSRLTQQGQAPVIDMLCTDPEGSLAGWISTPSDEPSVVDAVARQGGSASGTGPAEGTGASGQPSLVAEYAGIAGESSVERLGHARLAAPATNGTSKSKDRGGAATSMPPQRLAVLANADAAVRLLIDELDRLGVEVRATCTLWHAQSLVWDPASPGSRGASDDDARAAPVTAVVIATPDGRLVWSWSRGGRLEAAGSMRIRAMHPMSPASGTLAEASRTGSFAAKPAAEDRPRLLFGAPEAGRLCAEWLAWSLQLGLSPARVIAALPEGDTGSAAAFGEAVGRTWPGVTVDASLHEDPLSTTLCRLAERIDEAPRAAVDSGVVLRSLSARPGAAHRRMHVALALGLAGLAGLIGAAAWEYRGVVAEARRAAIQARESWRPLALEVKPEAAANEAGIVPLLEAEVAKLERETKPIEPKSPSMPVLRELEALSLVFGDPLVELHEVRVGTESAAGATNAIQIVVLAPRDQVIELANELREALEALGGSFAGTWSADYPQDRSGVNDQVKSKVRLTARWAPDAAERARATAASTAPNATASPAAAPADEPEAGGTP